VGLRERKKEAMRARLYESAMAMFRERGFVETRVRDIVEEAQVSEATFFNYFPSKEAVLRHTSLDTKRYYGAYLSNLVARRDEPAPDRLYELARVVASIFERDKEFMATLLSHTDLFFDSIGEAKDLDRANYELLADLFRQGQRSGAFSKRRDPRQLAEVLTAVQLLTIQNWVTNWWDDASQAPIEKRLRAAFDVVIRGAA
jgi:TetR/AcrR family transcriptional regulator, cholesterol catabolism regulator